MAPRLPRRLVIAVLLLLSVGGLAAGPAAGAVPPAYLDQQLAWSPCPGAPADVPLRCAAMIVPVDWDRASAGADLEVTVSRLPATDPARRRGALFTNPGGPGLPGRLYPLLWYVAKPDVLAVYDVVGMDPRGSGLSTPVRCDAHPADLPGDLRDRSRPNLDALRARALVGAAACVEPARGLARYMNTRQTVRDMDLLRALLGEPRISYLGTSAGTWLGAWYATEFPERVDRFVFDGNVDFTRSWYDNQLLRPRAFQRKFEGDFLPWLARYDHLYGYGATAAEAGARWEARRSALAAAPLVLGPACTVRASEFESTTWMAMLAAPGAPGGFLALARTLSILERLDAASGEDRRVLEEHLSCMAPTGLPIPGAADVLASEGTLCGDTQSPSYGRYQEDSVRLGRRYPLIGWWNEVLTGFCAFWPFPPTGAPHIDGAGLPPVLMVNGDRDPITPIEGAVDAARGFGAARLLVIENESQHTTYGLGNACADGYIDGYLLTGALPPAGATCPGLPLPVPPEAAAGAP